jgi:hypothetical protein
MMVAVALVTVWLGTDGKHPGCSIVLFLRKMLPEGKTILARVDGI